MQAIADFQVLGELGRGAMGVVYRARDPRLERDVAIKLMMIDSVTDEGLRRFHREVQAAAALNHINIVRVHRVDTHEGRPYLVMSLIEGESLQERLKRTGPLPPEDAAGVIRVLAEAVQHAHEHGVIHRDLKPANVMVDAASGEPILLDFGLVKILGRDTRITLSGEILGTPVYMPPEQANGDEVDARSDVYSLGATLYALLTGHPPFRGHTVIGVLESVLTQSPAPPSRFVPGLDPNLESIVLKCLEKDPAKRFETAQALADALAPGAQSSEARRKGPLRVAALAVLLLAGAGLIGLSYLHKARANAALKLRWARATADFYLHQEKDLQRAAEAADDIIALAPEEAIGYAYRGYLDWAQGKHRRALEALDTFLLLDRGEEPAVSSGMHMYRGNALRSLGDLDGALKAYTDGITLQPDLAGAYCGRSRVYQDRGQLDLALVELDRAVQAQPGNATHRVLRGKLLEVMGDFAAALGEFRAAREIDPNNTEAYQNRVRILRALNRLDEALQECARLEELVPDNPVPFQETARVLYDMGDLEAARIACDKLASRFPGSKWEAWAHDLKGHIFKRLGDPGRAEESFGRAVELDPSNPGYRRDRARLRLSQGNLQAGIADLEEALKLLASGEDESTLALVKTNLVDNLTKLGDRLILGQVATAVEVLARAHTLDPQSENVLLKLAMARLQAGDTEGASRDVTKVLEANPRLASAYIARSFIHEGYGRMAEALADAERAQTLAPPGTPVAEQANLRVRDLRSRVGSPEGRPGERAR